MKYTEYETSTPDLPEVVSSISFEDWPFEDERVPLNDTVKYIGMSAKVTQSRSDYHLVNGGDDVLALLADGTIAVTGGDFLAAYLERTGQKAVGQ